MIDVLAQAGIAILSPWAIVLVAKKNKWGFVAGLLSQPFWFITAFINNQPGVLFVSIVYSLCWLFGVHEWFFKGKKQGQKKAAANN